MAAPEVHGSTGAVPSSGRRDAQAMYEASGIGRRSESDLRFAVRAMDRQLVMLRTQPTGEQYATALGGLTTTWAALVAELAIGPAPELRSCPTCGRLGMSAATRCGYCWARITPTVR